MESAGQILGRLAYEYGQTQRKAAQTEVRAALLRIVPRALIGGILAYGLLRLWIILRTGDLALGIDYQWVMDQALRIRAGGPMFAEWELSRPIFAGEWVDLYPPTTVYLLFLPMSFLPAFVWWAVPLSIIGWSVWHHRPSLWGWVLILAAFIVWPHTWTAIQLGNPAIWISAFVALGTVHRWPAAFVLLKPSLFPLALIGVRSRAWWIAGIMLGLVSLAMIPAWLDYVQVLRNLRGFDWTYSVHDLGLLLIPVIAWLFRRPYAVLLNLYQSTTL